LFFGENPSLPAGPTVAFSNGGTISQTLAGIGLQPNTTYRLSVYIGHRLDGFITNYTLSLQAGSTVLQSVSGSDSTITAGTFANIVLTYTTGGTVAPGDLTVVLTIAGSQIDLDGVQSQRQPIRQRFPRSSTTSPCSLAKCLTSFRRTTDIRGSADLSVRALASGEQFDWYRGSSVLQ
jgi:hypothetical protein